MIRRLDLIRHGHALPTSSIGDAGRELSPEGLDFVRHLARRLAAAGWRPDVVLTSPITRARQTASLLVGEQPSMIPIEVLDELDADGDTPSALAAIDRAAQGRAHIVAVGHQPMIGLLIDRLTGASPSVSPGSCHSMVFDREFGFGVGRLLGAEERTA